MFTRPADLADDVVSAVVQEAWQLRIGRIDYAPVGFGSYHWHAWADEDRWFVTADDLVTGGSHLGTSPKERARRLAAALGTAGVLRADGMTFVVAPTPTVDGENSAAGRGAVGCRPLPIHRRGLASVGCVPNNRRAACGRRAAGDVAQTGGLHVTMPCKRTLPFHIATICRRRSPTAVSRLD